MAEVKLMSGVFEVRPHKNLFLNAGGPIQLTPKRIYKAFKTNYQISNQPGQDTIMMVMESEKGLRWFPVNTTYAKNNFEFITDSKVENQNEWLTKFRNENFHIRTKEKMIF